jgi:hypothetical protein
MEAPDFAVIGRTKETAHSAVRLIKDRGEKSGKIYYRDAGRWWCPFKIEGNKVIVDTPNDEYGMGHCNGMQIFEITQKEWENDNHGYLPSARAIIKEEEY